MQIRWRRAARVDLIAAVEYVRQRNPSAAAAVYGTVTSQIDLLADHPEIGRQGRVSGTRELVVVRTPYVVAYFVDESADAVIILRVLHGARRWPEEFR